MFGPDLVMSKIVSCQMHLKSDVNKALAKLGDSFRGALKKRYSKMLQWQWLLSTVNKKVLK